MFAFYVAKEFGSFDTLHLLQFECSCTCETMLPKHGALHAQRLHTKVALSREGRVDGRVVCYLHEDVIPAIGHALDRRLQAFPRFGIVVVVFELLDDWL